MAEHLDEPMTISPISQAEVLVRAVREGRDEAKLADIRSLGISSTALPDDTGQRLARLRAHTGAKMPDCCVLLTAGHAVSVRDTPMRRRRKGPLLHSHRQRASTRPLARVRRPGCRRQPRRR